MREVHSRTQAPHGNGQALPGDEPGGQGEALAPELLSPLLQFARMDADAFDRAVADFCCERRLSTLVLLQRSSECRSASFYRHYDGGVHTAIGDTVSDDRCQPADDGQGPFREGSIEYGRPMGRPYPEGIVERQCSSPT